jgi:TP53 regulating kinase and related kinases
LTESPTVSDTGRGPESLSMQIDFSPVQGAEARIELVEWYGKPAIRKSRIPKQYRLQELDQLLRTKRTKEEVEILYAAKLAGVPCPRVYFADPTSSEIILEYVRGNLLRNTPNSKSLVYEQLGRNAAVLHSRAIIHGDLTTKNVIVNEELPILIDFGLSFYSDRLEDKAEDLHLLKQALKSSESDRRALLKFDHAMKGYSEIAGGINEKVIRKQIAKIELRGRYAQVD